MTFIQCYDPCSSSEVTQGVCRCNNQVVGHPKAILKANTYVQQPSIQPLLYDMLSAGIGLMEMLDWPDNRVESLANWSMNSATVCGWYRQTVGQPFSEPLM